MAVYLERRTDTNGKEEYWVWHKILYNNPLPKMPLWMVDVFRENHNQPCGIQWIGSFLSSLVSKHDSSDNWLVAGRNAGGSWIGEADLRWNESGLGWGNFADGVDDAETAGFDSTLLRTSSTAGAYGDFTFTITSALEGASLEIQMGFWWTRYKNWKLTVTKDGSPFALNGRGLLFPLVRIGGNDYATMCKTPCWDSNGIYNNDNQGADANYANMPMEILRNLETGTYTVKLEYYNQGASSVCLGRVRLRKQSGSYADIKPDDANRTLYFAEYDNTAGNYFSRSVWQSGTRSSIIVAVRKSGDANFNGGNSHGGETQSSATFKIDGVVQTPAQGDIVSGSVCTVETSGMIEDDAAANLVQSDVTYTINDSGLTISPTLTWQQTTTIELGYVGMYLPNHAVDGVVPTPYHVSQYVIGSDAPKSYPPGAKDDGYTDEQWKLLHNDTSLNERNVGRTFYWENTPAGWGGFNSSTLKKFMQNTGKFYTTIAENTPVTNGETFGPMPTLFYYAETDYVPPPSPTPTPSGKITATIIQTTENTTTEKIKKDYTTIQLSGNPTETIYQIVEASETWKRPAINLRSSENILTNGNLVSITAKILRIILKFNTAYKLRYRTRTNGSWSSWTEVSFRTRNKDYKYDREGTYISRSGNRVVNYSNETRRGNRTIVQGNPAYPTRNGRVIIDNR